MQLANALQVGSPSYRHTWLSVQGVNTVDVDVADPPRSSAALRLRLAGMRSRLAEAERQALDAVLPHLSKLTAEPAGKDHRNHHFIPKFWLDRFADDRRVCVVDPSGEQRPRLAHIRRESSERDLYAMHAGAVKSREASDSEVTVVWEHVTRIFDERAAPLLDRLTAAREGSTVPLSDVDRYWLSVFLRCKQFASQIISPASVPRVHRSFGCM